MASFIKNIMKLSLVAIALPGTVIGAQQPNPRGVANSVNDGRSVDEVVNESVRRSATSVIARSMTQNKRQSKPVVTARPVAARAASVRSVRPVTGGEVNVARSATKSSVARSGSKPKAKDTNASRAGVARATAVFNDVSKIGGGYSSCRDSYATCMDQICANANDTYRRCFCSDRFAGFRDTSDRIDQAVKLLAEFQNVNLDAVNKTAEEVNAMYTATAGEEAIKRDTSAAQKLLNSIDDILSGKKTSYVSKGISAQTTTSLGILDFSGFSSDVDNAFSDTSSPFDSDSIVFKGFGSSSYSDISALEGADLYNAAMKQCTQITREACAGDAIFNLARSSYSILVTQDCNAYEKKLNAKKTTLEDTVRTAEKYLRQARLEEYRAHNSQDVNECLTAVEAAMRQPLVCGSNYELCLDYTGRYINATTGDPIYSQALFGLNDLIVLDGTADVVKANPDFSKTLEDKKKFAETELNTCRGIADTVWAEFKRMAIIKIAQAQDDKIEEVKSSCVETMKDCYDTQSNSLNDMADTTKSQVGAISAIAARGMCKDKVLACAALYGDVDGCLYDDKTKKLEAVNGKKCGLQSLLALVDAVDTVKIEKGCADSIRAYAKETCAADSADNEHEYPWGCRGYAVGKPGDSARAGTTTLYALLEKYAAKFCALDIDDSGRYTAKNGGDQRLVADTSTAIEKVVSDIRGDLGIMLDKECESYNGIWVYDTQDYADDSNNTLLKAFYNRVFNGKTDRTEFGKCLENTVMTQCLIYNADEDSDKQYASYDKKTDTCTFTDAWYQDKCSSIGGSYENSVCYVPKK